LACRNEIRQIFSSLGKKLLAIQTQCTQQTNTLAHTSSTTMHTTESASHASTYTSQQDIEYQQHVSQQPETSGNLGTVVSVQSGIPSMQDDTQNHAQLCTQIRKLQEQGTELYTI